MGYREREKREERREKGEERREKGEGRREKGVRSKEQCTERSRCVKSKDVLICRKKRHNKGLSLQI
jgi:hypothetical protein